MNTKEKIIDAAIQNVAVHGYKGATMKSIASDCEIKSASIYYFFKNKQSLMMNVLNKVLRNHFEEMKSVYFKNEGAPAIEKMQKMLQGIAQHHTENSSERKVYLQLLETNNDHLKNEVSKYLKQYDEWLFEKLEKDLKIFKQELTDEQLNQVLNHFLLIGNAVFWATNIYTVDEIEREVSNAKALLKLSFDNILMEGGI